MTPPFRTVIAPLIAALATCIGAAAQAQDPLVQARETYRTMSGTWTAPGLSCADPRNTWSFGMDMVRAGDATFDLRGIGAGPGTVRLDLISRQTGLGLPLALSFAGPSLNVWGSGISAVLVPCEPGGDVFARVEPPGAITTLPLDPAPGRAPEPPAAPVDPAGDEDAAAAAAEQRLATDLSGAWSGGDGRCTWRLSASRIFADGEAFDVVNVAGTAERIGIQALRGDGTPATFTLIRTGPDAAALRGSVAGDAAIAASLTRC